MPDIILQGDVLARLRELPDEYFHCVITSPPYFALRDYGVPGQIGLESTPAEYLGKMVQVFREVWRVLRKDGLVFLNMGDSYAGSGKGRNADGIHNSKCGDKSRTNRGAIAGTIIRGKRSGARWGGGNAEPDGFKEKDLLMVPARLAIALQDDGWWVRSPIIWEKPNAMPESCDDRPTTSHEYVYMLAKNGADAIYWTHQDGRGTRRRPKPDYYFVEIEGRRVRKNKWRGHAYFYDSAAIAEPLSPEMMQKPWKMEFDGERPDVGGTARSNGRRGAIKKPSGWDAEADGQGHRELVGRYKSGNKERKFRGDYGGPEGSRSHQGFGVPWEDTGVGRNARTVWTIPSQPFKGAHFATFPEELVRRCLFAGTSERGCCPKCDAPLERITEVEYENPYNRESNGPRSIERRWVEGGTAGFEKRLERIAKTLRWARSCECELPVPNSPNRCRVLDPFFGSGTVGLVALRHGRSFVGIDLNPEYVKMARERLKSDFPLYFHDVGEPADFGRVATC